MTTSPPARQRRSAKEGAPSLRHWGPFKAYETEWGFVGILDIVYIHMFKKRETERERERDIYRQICTCICIHPIYALCMAYFERSARVQSVAACVLEVVRATISEPRGLCDCHAKLHGASGYRALQS